MKNFFSAASFLTIIPIPQRLYENADFKKAPAFFPVIGLLIGLICAGVSYISLMIFPVLIAGLISCAAMIKISGALHLDGLADSADGLLSSRSKNEMLEIMGDSRIGAMGATALVLIILLKVFCLIQLGSDMWLAVLLAAVVGRTALIHIPLFFSPAKEDGLGVSTGSKFPYICAASWIASMIIAYASFGGQGILSVLFAILMIFVLNYFINRKIGGYTGDTLGATCEAAEVWTLLALTAFPN